MIETFTDAFNQLCSDTETKLFAREQMLTEEGVIQSDFYQMDSNQQPYSHTHAYPTFTQDKQPNV